MRRARGAAEAVMRRENEILAEIQRDSRAPRAHDGRNEERTDAMLENFNWGMGHEEQKACRFRRKRRSVCRGRSRGCAKRSSIWRKRSSFSGKRFRVWSKRSSFCGKRSRVCGRFFTVFGRFSPSKSE